jgi:hypothetical protein
VRIKLEGTPPFELPMIHSSTTKLNNDNIQVVLQVLAGNKLLPIHATMTFETAEALALQLGTTVFRAKNSPKTSGK